MHKDIEKPQNNKNSLSPENIFGQLEKHNKS